MSRARRRAVERRSSTKSDAPLEIAGSESAVRRLQQQLGNRTLGKLMREGFDVAPHDDARESDAEAVAAGNVAAIGPASDEHPIGGGAPLDPALRQLLEQRVGRGLGQVRVRRDDDAAEALGAKAFTAGSDIVVGRDASFHVLAHEAGHATQSRSRTILRYTAREVIDLYSDTDARGVYLASLARGGQYTLVGEVIEQSDYSDSDDVAMAMLNALTIRQLITVARSPAGRTMLGKAREAISSGWVRRVEADKAHLIDALLGDPTERKIWNTHRIEEIRDAAPSDAEALARIFEDDQIVDDGDVQSRLQSILSATEHLVIPGLQTGISFSDTGFRGDQTPNGPGFRDPWPSSRNQPGHFLTAVGLFWNPALVSRDIPGFGSVRQMVGAPAAMPDAEVALRLTIGHEKSPDPPGGLDVALSILFTGIAEDWSSGPEGETEEEHDRRVGQAMVDETRRQINAIIAAFRAQFQATTDADVAAWNETLTQVGSNPAANVTAIEGPSSPLNRIAVDPSQRGNSRQDLRLSLMGWRLGQMIRDGTLATGAAVAAWIRANLEAPPP